MRNHSEQPIDEDLPEIDADLVTPLSAYLQLRESGPSFLLESVQQGRLGRYSFVGSGARVVGLEQAERLHADGAAVVGYVGYDHVARLEPVELPGSGPDLADSGFIVAETLIRFDHPAGRAHLLLGEADAITPFTPPVERHRSPHGIV
ncbi:MAG: hypothetical protein M3P18_16710, partial [Actinomycetota bacterium]|nr:hypothetical protein [Actinomycetota bacterium]